jgi:hypothetical protein
MANRTDYRRLLYTLVDRGKRILLGIVAGVVLMHPGAARGQRGRSAEVVPGYLRPYRWRWRNKPRIRLRWWNTRASTLASSRSSRPARRERLSTGNLFIPARLEKRKRLPLQVHFHSAS